MAGLNGLVKQRVADFVHGRDGFGNLAEARVPTVRRAMPPTTPLRALQRRRRRGGRPPSPVAGSPCVRSLFLHMGGQMHGLESPPLLCRVSCRATLPPSD